MWNTSSECANTAGSYYKGKPGPEDQAPQSLSMGNRGSILYSKLHAGTHKLLEGGEKTQNSRFCAPADFQAQVYSKGNLIPIVTNGWVTKAEHFHDTSPPLGQDRRWHIITLLVWHTSAKAPRGFTQAQHEELTQTTRARF